MDDAEIPEPLDSGTDGSQRMADENSFPTPAPPWSSSVANALIGIATSNSRTLGGVTVSALIAGAVSQMNIEISETKRELFNLRNKYENINKELSDRNVENAILNERIDSYRVIRNVTNIAILVGTLLTGLGVQLILEEKLPYGIALSIVGSLLVLPSLLYVPKRGVK